MLNLGPFKTLISYIGNKKIRQYQMKFVGPLTSVLWGASVVANLFFLSVLLTQSDNGNYICSYLKLIFYVLFCQSKAFFIRFQVQNSKNIELLVVFLGCSGYFSPAVEQRLILIYCILVCTALNIPKNDISFLSKLQSL